MPFVYHSLPLYGFNAFLLFVHCNKECGSLTVFLSQCAGKYRKRYTHKKTPVSRQNLQDEPCDGSATISCSKERFPDVHKVCVNACVQVCDSVCVHKGATFHLEY